MLFAQALVEWYEENKRALPWRETTDPYKIWLSEIILQQTRVAQGLPYYQKFVARFPRVNDLAKANIDEVLRYWQGLGYYSRARNLHACAKKVVADFNSKFPDTYSQLIQLPGVGPYTAAAIASIAFQERVAVVDGNVFRVLARIFGLHTDISSNEGKKLFFEHANKLIPDKRPDLFNQAMMEFGATWCTPKNPQCGECVFKKTCVALQQGLVAQLPVKAKKAKVKKRYLYYMVIEHKGKIAMQRRDTKDIWRGLYDFPLVETQKRQPPEKALNKNFSKSFGTKKLEIAEEVKHILSHQVLHIRFCWWKTSALDAKKKKSLTFYSPRDVSKLPKPIVITRFLEERGFIRKV